MHGFIYVSWLSTTLFEPSHLCVGNRCLALLLNMHKQTSVCLAVNDFPYVASYCSPLENTLQCRTENEPSSPS